MLLRFDRAIILVAIECIHEKDANDVAFLMTDLEWIFHPLNLTVLIINTEAILAIKWFKEVCSVKGAAQFNDYIVFLEAILIVFVESV